MPDPTPPTVQMSDVVTIALHSARNRLRSARILAEEQQDTVQQRALITTALDATQDALDVRAGGGNV